MNSILVTIQNKYVNSQVQLAPGYELNSELLKMAAHLESQWELIQKLIVGPTHETNGVKEEF